MINPSIRVLRKSRASREISGSTLAIEGGTWLRVVGAIPHGCNISFTLDEAVAMRTWLDELIETLENAEEV